MFSGCALLIFFNRLGELLHNNNIAAIMTTDIFIFGLTAAIGYKTFKGSLGYILMSFGLGIFALFFPQFIQRIVIFLMTSLILLVSFDWVFTKDTNEESTNIK